MKRIILLLRAQKCWRIGRVFSAVRGFALVRSLAGATQMFSTPSRGAIHEIHLPSGLTRPWVFSGLPKKSARGISSTPLDCDWAAGMMAPINAAPSSKRMNTDIWRLLSKCGDAHDLDLVGRVRELRLDRGARRGLAGHHPFFPGDVHAREILHVREEDLGRQELRLVASRLLQESVDLLEHLFGLPGDVLRRVVG